MMERQTALVATLGRIDFAIRSEFEIVSQRMTWLMASESFLLTAYTLGGAQARKGDGVENLGFVLMVIPPVAVAVALLVWLSVVGALGNVAYLSRQRATLESEFSEAMEVMSLSDSFAHRIVCLRNLPPLIVPVILVLIWTINS